MSFLSFYKRKKSDFASMNQFYLYGERRVKSGNINFDGLSQERNSFFLIHNKKKNLFIMLISTLVPELILNSQAQAHTHTNPIPI